MPAVQRRLKAAPSSIGLTLSQTLRRKTRAVLVLALLCQDKENTREISSRHTAPSSPGVAAQRQAPGYSNYSGGEQSAERSFFFFLKHMWGWACPGSGVSRHQPREIYCYQDWQFWQYNSVLSVDACKPGLVSAVLVKVLAGIYRKGRSAVAAVYRAWRKNDCHLCLLLPDLSCSMLCVYAALRHRCCATLRHPCCATLCYRRCAVCSWDTPPQPWHCEGGSAVFWITVVGQHREDKDLISSIRCTAAGRQFIFWGCQYFHGH